MARGSIVWRCPSCGDKYNARCKHKGGKYYIVYPTQTWDRETGKTLKKKKWEAIGTVKDKAEEELAKRVQRVHDGTYRDLKEITFAEFAPKWLNDYARGAVKNTTLSAYSAHINKHFMPVLGPLAMRNIREDTIQGYMADQLAAKQSAKSVKNHVVLLKTMFKHAVRWGYLAVNSLADLEPPRVEWVEMDFLTATEVLHLLTGIHTDGKPFVPAGGYVPIKLAIFSGLRQGEQAALRIGDVDFFHGQIRVRRSLSWLWKKPEGGVRYEFTSPKTMGSIRKVDLAPDLLEDLRRYIAGLPPYFRCVECGKRAPKAGECCSKPTTLVEPGPDDLLFSPRPACRLNRATSSSGSSGRP